MSRTKSAPAVADETDHNGQYLAFPELEAANPDHKELIRRAKKYSKGKVERDELLKSNKEEVDELMQGVLEQMEVCKLPKFKHGGTLYEEVKGKAKVKLTIDTSSEDDEGDDDGEDE